MQTRLVMAALTLMACTRPADDAVTGGERWCRSWALEPTVEYVDVLFIVDDSAVMATLQPRIQAELGRIVDEQLAFDQGQVDRSYHFGVISADPADGARLRGGCGLADRRPYVAYRRGVLSNLEPGAGVGGTVGCLAAAGSAGAGGQQPMGQAAQLLAGDLVENRGFRRRGACLTIVFVLGGSYDESAAALLKEHQPPRWTLASLAPPSPGLDQLLATDPLSQQLPADATDWSPLFAWDKSVAGAYRTSPCLSGALPDNTRPDVVVTDQESRTDGELSLLGQVTSGRLRPPLFVSSRHSPVEAVHWCAAFQERARLRNSKSRSASPPMPASSVRSRSWTNAML